MLFCDLVGFTERSDRADPEDVKATLRPYHAAIKRIAEGFGGMLDAFVGDGAVVVFGAPTSHEDDAERAIHVAFRIQREIETLNRRSVGPPLAVRIGIDTGEAVVTLGRGPQIGDRVTGDVVASAGRLQALAPVGGIAVGEATHRATKGRFEFEPVGAADADAWRPIQVSRPVHQPPNTLFVGRERDAALLRSTYRRGSSERSVQLVTISGEAGVGKTRLVEDFAAYLDAEPDLIRWREGRCLPYGEAVTFWPLTEMVKTEAGILENDTAAEARAKLTRAVESVTTEPSDRDWLLNRLAPLAGLDEPSTAVDRTEAFTAWRRYFEALAAQHALVLVFEDLHWAEEGLLAFIEHLVTKPPTLPILVICVARPSLLERPGPWSDDARSLQIPLPPLTDTETAILLSSLLDRAVLPAQTQTALLERSGGNPLYAEEFVRMLMDRGLIQAGTLVAPSAAAEIPIPDTVQAIIDARLDALPHDAKLLLHDASVVGPVFWSGALVRMGARTEDEVRAELAELARLELIRPTPASSVKGDDEHVFWHNVVRDVAYAQIPRSERSAKHRAVAEWLGSLSTERMADRAELIAYHYGQALELGDPLDDELRARTIRATELAARTAFQLDASVAESHLEKVLALMTEDDPARARILVRLAEVETTQACFAEARRDFDRAIEALEDAGDAVGLGEALALKTRALQRPGDTREVRALLERAIAILEAEPPGPQLARALTAFASEALTNGRFEECRELARRALELARGLGMDQEVVRALQYRGAARCELGDAEGLADLWEAVRLGLGAGFGVETAVAYSNLAVELWGLVGPATAVQVWEASAEFARVRGFRNEEIWARCGFLEVAFDLGRWDELIEVAQEIAQADPEAGGGQMRAFADVYRASVLARRGLLQEAVLLVEEALPRIRIMRRVEFLAPALTVAAVLEDLRGHLSTATDLLDEFGRETEGQDVYRLLFLPDAVRVMVACDVDRAKALILDEARARNQRHRLAIRTATAAVAEATGDPDGAAELYEACAEDWERFGSELERAHALFGRGRCLRETGAPEAAKTLARAREEFAALGAEPWVQQADEVVTPRSVAT